MFALLTPVKIKKPGHRASVKRFVKLCRAECPTCRLWCVNVPVSSVSNGSFTVTVTVKPMFVTINVAVSVSGKWKINRITQNHVYWPFTGRFGFHLQVVRHWLKHHNRHCLQYVQKKSYSINELKINGALMALPSLPPCPLPWLRRWATAQDDLGWGVF